ncbi:hypothetical protein E2K80_17815 [Rhodophyticola sp. CCM32]|uniref:DUF6693 family protein n=1 Tax=Rhodophyticola sp. CCM32 TaxID=2916397 RepID=UPI00107F039D|nr:DUF6693 family protein [Rhodophyticola sp. CCM32]QBY02370.1 hypothetical protein E2K80_17815 [Rhodophyticola sp. CCM32]
MVVGSNLKCEFSLSEAIGQLIIWILLAIITFGLALFVLPYYFVKAPINRTFVVDRDGTKLARLNVEVSFSDILGHALVWLLLTIVTFGLAYLVYWPAVIKRVLNASKMVEL